MIRQTDNEKTSCFVFLASALTLKPLISGLSGHGFGARIRSSQCDNNVLLTAAISLISEDRLTSVQEARSLTFEIHVFRCGPFKRAVESGSIVFEISWFDHLKLERGSFLGRSLSRPGRAGHIKKRYLPSSNHAQKK